MLIWVLAALCFVGVTGDSKDCINKKYGDDLGDPYKVCYNRTQELPIPRMKKCYQEVMKSEQVVKVANDGQMTVDRDKFGEYGRQHNNYVGRAMAACYNNTRSDDRMYREAARASQCVFDGMKKDC